MRIPIKWLKEYVDIPENLKEFTDKMSMIGHLLDKIEETENDTVIDLELRGNRADCYSILGIAREAKACFGGVLKIPSSKFQIPKNRDNNSQLTINKEQRAKNKEQRAENKEQRTEDREQKTRSRTTEATRNSELVTPNSSAREHVNFEILVQTPVVKRFYSVVITGLKVGPSPEWMQKRLKDYGIEPINNIVDVTNYVMIESGMPLHAFDLDKMHGNKLILRQAEKGEKVVTFDGGELTLTENDPVFGAEDGTVLGIPAIVGGKDSGIHDDTVNILLECAGYDRVAIRKAMHRHAAMTEAGLRHSHDLSSSLCDYALSRAASLIIELAGNGDFSKFQDTNDYYPEPEKQRVIEYDPNEVKRLGGVEISVQEQKEILERLEFEIKEQRAKNEEQRTENREPVNPLTREHVNSFRVSVPLFRTDIFASEDVVEEVLRIWGYEKIPSTILSSVIPEPIVQVELTIEEKSKDILASLGIDEVITVPMTTLEKLKKTNDPKTERAVGLMNPSSSEHTHLRSNMYTGLLGVVARAMDRGDEKVAFFEAGKLYLKKDKPFHQPPHKPEFPYMEQRRVAAVFTSKNKEDWDFYKIKGFYETYLDQMHIQNVDYVKFDHQQFELMAKVKQEDLVIGAVGLLKREITEKNFGIKTDVYAFIIDVESIVEAQKTLVSYMPYSQYPAVKQDMSVLIDYSVQAGDLVKTIKEVGGEVVRSVDISDIYEMEGKRSLLFNITYQSKERTLSTDEVNQLHIKIENVLKERFGAVIRGREAGNPKEQLPITSDELLEHPPYPLQRGNSPEESEATRDSKLGTPNSSSDIPPGLAEQHATRNTQLVTENSSTRERVNSVVIGKILEIQKHPNADKLVICKVDVGRAMMENTLFADYLQIITGADNIKPGIAEGKYVPVALPGAEVISHKTGDKFTIGIGNLRGEVSEGMLCSKSELGIPDDVGGIWILDESYGDRIGEAFAVGSEQPVSNTSKDKKSQSSQRYETDPVYLIDSYKKEIDATVLNVEEEGKNQYRLVLDKTIFYPLGGGQATDQGKIESKNWKGEIYQVLAKEGNIIHYVKTTTRPEIGDSIHGEINWDRRYKNMRLHSAGHIIDFAMYMLGYSPMLLIPYKGDHNKNPHIAYKGKLNKDIKQELENKANDIVNKGLSLSWEFKSLEELEKEAIYLQPGLPANKPLRALTLEEIGTVADGGTQVKNTKEIGKISLDVKEEGEDTIVYYSIL